MAISNNMSMRDMLAMGTVKKVLTSVGTEPLTERKAADLVGFIQTSITRLGVTNGIAAKAAFSLASNVERLTNPSDFERAFISTFMTTKTVYKGKEFSSSYSADLGYKALVDAGWLKDKVATPRLERVLKRVKAKKTPQLTDSFVPSLLKDSRVPVEHHSPLTERCVSSLEAVTWKVGTFPFDRLTHLNGLEEGNSNLAKAVKDANFALKGYEHVPDSVYRSHFDMETRFRVNPTEWNSGGGFSASYVSKNMTGFAGTSLDYDKEHMFSMLIGELGAIIEVSGGQLVEWMELSSTNPDELVAVLEPTCGKDAVRASWILFLMLQVYTHTIGPKPEVMIPFMLDIKCSGTQLAGLTFGISQLAAANGFNTLYLDDKVMDDTYQKMAMIIVAMYEGWTRNLVKAIYQGYFYGQDYKGLLGAKFKKDEPECYHLIEATAKEYGTTMALVANKLHEAAEESLGATMKAVMDTFKNCGIKYTVKDDGSSESISTLNHNLVYKTCCGATIAHEYFMEEGFDGEKWVKGQKENILELSSGVFTARLKNPRYELTEEDTLRSSYTSFVHFIHSIDALFLRLVVDNMNGAPIATIHDNFLTSWEHVDTLEAALKKAYTSLFGTRKIVVDKAQMPLGNDPQALFSVGVIASTKEGETPMNELTAYGHDGVRIGYEIFEGQTMKDLFKHSLTDLGCCKR